MANADGNLEKKFGSAKITEDGVSTCASRMTQGIFVGHHDRTGAVSLYHQGGRHARQNLDETNIE